MSNMSSMSKSYPEELPVKRLNILSRLPESEFNNIFNNVDKVKSNKSNDSMKREDYVKILKNWAKKLCTEYRSEEYTDEQVGYKYSKKLITNGREYADRFSVQNLQRDLRAYLCSKKYVDVDIKNAHPSILYYLMKKYYPEESFTFLRTYVKNRDEVLKKIPNAKNQILIIMNGNKSYDGKNKFLIDLDIEFKKAQKLLFEQVNEFTKDIFNFKALNKQNKYGRFLNIVLCCFEKKVLNEAIEAIEEEFDNQVSTKIFDGFHLVKSADNKKQLEILNKTTKKYRLTWAFKQFSNKLDYLDNFEDLEEEEEHFDYDSVKERFEKKFFMIESPVIFGKDYIFNDKPTYALYSKQDFKTLTDHIRFNKLICDNGKGKSYYKSVNFFTEWLKDPERRSFKKIDFLPTLKTQKEFYNTFKGFDSEIIKYPKYKYDKKAVADFIKHIQFLTDYEKKSEEYLTAFLADIIQQPEKPKGTAILIKSKQGYGKDKLIDIMEKVIGHQFVHRTEKIEEVLGQFNSPIKDKVICVINELESKDGWDYRDKLKGLITKETITINEKGIKQYDQKWSGRIFIFSNRINPIEVTADNRRFVVFKCHYKKPNEQYFNNLVENVENNKNSIYSIFEYLKNYKIKINLRHDIPKTKAIEDMKTDNVNPIYHFINDVILQNKIDEYFEKEDDDYKIHKKTQNILINSKIFFNAYKHNYLEDNSLTYLKPTYKQVKQNLNEIDLQKKKIKINNDVNEYWIFNKEEINKKITEMNLGQLVEEMEDDEFE